TDNLDEPVMWRIPSGTLIPKAGYLVFWADGQDVGLHTDFRLNRVGEQLGLYTPDRIVVDALSFGTQQDDMSFGRLENSETQWVVFDLPTPGRANDASHAVDVTPSPLFSITGGFFQGRQVLSFLNSDQLNIYYSLDGTPPNDNSHPYQGPIALDKTVVVRAIGILQGLAPSEILTHTFFIDEEINLPFISIVTDPDNFFSDERGIYVTGTRGRGGYCDSAIRNLKQDWERPVNIELYDVEGQLGLNQRAGVKIFGGCSRHRFPQKSLALFARRTYGKGSFQYQLFRDKDIDSFESFILRSSADDQVLTLFRDALSQTVLTDTMNADTQAYRPAVVFLNGQYWGIHNIREKINEHYMAGNHGVDPDAVNLLEGNGTVAAGTHAGYTAMVNYANTHSMADPGHYQILKDQIDIDQYIDYQIGHIYLAENDWPGNNIKFWRTNSGPYSRWRWVNFDMDQCFMSRAIDENMIHKTTTALETTWPNPEWSTRLFRNLLENEGFRNEFIQRYAYHMNTTFDPDRLLGVIDELQGALASEMFRHIDRWGGQKDPDATETWQSPTFNSVTRWEQNIDAMRLFAIERPAATTPHFVEHFGLSGTSNVELALDPADSGVFKINNKPLPAGFKGDYFNGIPIVAHATPRAGYIFSHWDIPSMADYTYAILPAGSLWKYSDTGADFGSDWQEPEYDDTGWASGPAELGYGDQDEETLVRAGGGRNSQFVTTYFRASFGLTDVTRFRGWMLSLLVDDGAVAYLNGQEIARVNMPGGTVRYDTLASRAIGHEETFAEFYVSSEFVRSGINTLAVEVHQAPDSVSDMSFDCIFAGQTDVEGQSAGVTTPRISVTLFRDTQLKACFSQDAAVRPDPVIITEINFDSAPEADTDDWVELFNQSGTAIDLTGWRFVDSVGHGYEFPPNHVFWPGETLVLCRNKIRFKSVHPHVKNLLGNFEFGLKKGGESLSILDAQNQVMDQVDYASVSPWPDTARETGYPIELVDASSDNGLGENWRAETLFGTPGVAFQPK
ncbi:MAG: CotH kinase family protein, partial [Phycisphaeraceae bacterium]|nr:CotH kinase family protein [Phycisphaeraceae bacterium]